MSQSVGDDLPLDGRPPRVCGRTHQAHRQLRANGRTTRSVPNPEVRVQTKSTLSEGLSQL